MFTLDVKQQCNNNNKSIMVYWVDNKCHSRDVWFISFDWLFFTGKFSYPNCVDPYQTLRFAASDQGLHTLPLCLNDMLGIYKLILIFQGRLEIRSVTNKDLTRAFHYCWIKYLQNFKTTKT